MQSNCVCPGHPTPARSDTAVYHITPSIPGYAIQNGNGLMLSTPVNIPIMNVTSFNPPVANCTKECWPVHGQTVLQVPEGRTLHTTSSSPACMCPTNLYVASMLSAPCEVQDYDNDKHPLLSEDGKNVLSHHCGLSKSFSLGSCERKVKNMILGSKSDIGKQLQQKKLSAMDSLSFSTITSDGPICRICHDGDQGGELLQPCKCCGTLSYAHQNCLEKWLQVKNQDVCELCQFQFHTRRKDRPFKEWLQTPTRPRDRRNIVMDILCFCLLTPMVFTSAWLCLHGAHYYLSNYTNRSLEGMGLVVLASILLIIFLFWSAVSLRYHYSVWSIWRRENQLIHVVVHDRLKPPLMTSLKDTTHRNEDVTHDNKIFIPDGEMDINGNFTRAVGGPQTATFV